MRSLLRNTCLVIVLCLLAQPLTAARSVAEYELKAILLHRLVQFIYWPAGHPPAAPSVCVAGDNPFGSALEEALRGSGSRPLPAPRTLEGCDLLFVAQSESGNLERWLQRSHSQTLVTVSDIPGFARRGGMIELPLEGERVAVIVNREVARRQGFDFNAQLLRLARVIE